MRHDAALRSNGANAVPDLLLSPFRQGSTRGNGLARTVEPTYRYAVTPGHNTSELPRHGALVSLRRAG